LRALSSSPWHDSVAFGSALICVGVLNDEQHIIFIWGYHDFILLGPNAQECQIILGIQRPYYTTSFGCKLRNEGRVVFCIFRRHIRFYGNTILVHNQNSSHAPVGLDSLQSLFNFRRHLVTVLDYLYLSSECAPILARDNTPIFQPHLYLTLVQSIWIERQINTFFPSGRLRQTKKKREEKKNDDDLFVDVSILNIKQVVPFRHPDREESVGLV
jgi:hypothetical protein